jgi:hypothetical protein
MKRLYQLMDKIRQYQVESSISNIENVYSTLDTNNKENSPDNDTTHVSECSSSNHL